MIIQRTVFMTCGILAVYGAAAFSVEEKPLTEQECVEFGKRIEKELAAGNTAVLEEEFDLQGILGRAFEGTDASETVREGLMTALKPPNSLASALMNCVPQGGNCKFKRVQQTGGEFHVLFRATAPRGVGANYHDFTLRRDTRGRVRITDWLTYNLGESFCQTQRRLYLQANATLGKLGGSDQLSKIAEAWRGVTDAATGGQPAEAKKRYAELPASLQSERVMLALRVMWASKLGEAELDAAIQAVEKAFPDDPWSMFVRLEGLNRIGKFDEELRILDKLIQVIGADGYLIVLKSNCYAAKKDWANAVAFGRKAIDEEPDLLISYWPLLQAHLSQKDFASVRDVMLMIERRKVAVIGNVEENNAFSEFVKSPEYQQWLKERPKQGAPARDGDGNPDAGK